MGLRRGARPWPARAAGDRGRRSGTVRGALSGARQRHCQSSQWSGTSTLGTSGLVIQCPEMGHELVVGIEVPYPALGDVRRGLPDLVLPARTVDPGVFLWDNPGQALAVPGNDGG